MTADTPHAIVASSPEHKLLVIAPPGCGKTELLAMRANYLIPHLEAGQRILALTFTNRARANLAGRLRSLLGTSRYRRFVTVRNFHGHAADIVTAHGSTLGLPNDMEMPTTKTLPAALAKHTTDRAVGQEVVTLLEELKRQPFSDEELLVEIDKKRNAVARHVEVQRVANNTLHYQDLLRHAQRLLAVPTVGHLYRRHYGAVLVDEFQDLSDQQLRVSLLSGGPFHTFVGDPTQGIYSWAGAEPKRVLAQLNDLCGDAKPLTVSFRSSPAVLAMVNAVSDVAAGGLRARDPKLWKDGGCSVAIAARDSSHEASIIHSVCQEILKRRPEASIGVITRSGWRRKDIDEVFTSTEGPSARRWDLAIEDPEVVDLISSTVAQMKPSASYPAALKRTLSAIDATDIETVEKVREAFEHLAATGHSSPRAALSRLRVTDSDAPVAPGVHLLNAHTGKGQEFDWVVVPGLEEKHVPDGRSLQGEGLEEEKRVLLVMLSRARHGLLVTRAQSLTGRFGPYKPSASRWWDGLNAAATMSINEFKDHLKAL